MNKAELCKYPNLAMLIHYHTYSYVTFAHHAGITEQLLHKVLSGEANIFPQEVLGITRLFTGMPETRVPLSVLLCEKPILLDKNRYRHRRMIDSLQQRFDLVKDDTSYPFDIYVKKAEKRVKPLIDVFQIHPVYYTAYLAAVHAVEHLEFLHAASQTKYRDC